MNIGERIKQRRKELNMTQMELAQKLGYTSKASISNIERNKEDLTTARIAKIASALNCHPGFLWGWIDTPNVEIHLSEHEQELINAYRNSSPDLQIAVCAVLGVKRDLKSETDSLQEA